MLNYTELLEIAVKAALDAGTEIMEIYTSDDFDISVKNDKSPLTKADIRSHEVIDAYLKSTWINVLSEEGKEIPYEIRKDWETLWIVDPIDGTKEFINKNGEFTVNIALIQNQAPVLGVIYVPATKELYYSTIEIGAFKIQNFVKFEEFQNYDKSIRLPIKESNRPFTVVASRSHMTTETADFIKELEDRHGTVESISKGSSLKLCMVAEGKAECYPRFAPTMEWDTAAGQAICEHAGFSVLDWKTKRPMLYNRPELLNNWFLVQ